MTKKILSIEGGGTRGVFAAMVIEAIEKRWKIKVSEQFDMFCGTSTGAIVASALAMRDEGAEIRGWYEENENIVFGGPERTGVGGIINTRWPVLRARYRDRSLKRVLQEKFGTTELGEIKVPLMIPATELRNGSVYMFKSGYDAEFKRDQNVLLWEAVRASCAAPTYFDPFEAESTDGGLFGDGGIWCNNPSLAAVVEAEYRLGWRREEIRILSIGTGQMRVQYDARDEKRGWRRVLRAGWGICGHWRGTRLADLTLGLQGICAHNMTCLSLGQAPRPGQHGVVVRIDWETDTNLQADERGAGANHAARANRAVTYSQQAINALLEAE